MEIAQRRIGILREDRGWQKKVGRYIWYGRGIEYISGSTGTDVVKGPSFYHLFVVLQVVTLKSKSAIFLLLIPSLKYWYLNNGLRNRLILLTTLIPVDGVRHHTSSGWAIFLSSRFSNNNSKRKRKHAWKLWWLYVLWGSQGYLQQAIRKWVGTW